MKTCVNWFLLNWFFSLSGFSTTLNVQIIRKLSYAETSTAQLFHAQKLWVGISRLGFDPYYAVETYTSDGKLLQHLPLAHSSDNMYRYGQDGVIILGRSNDGHVSSHYTVVQIRNSRMVKTKEVSFGMDAMAQYFAGTSQGQQFFGAPGGSDSINLSEPFNGQFGTRSLFTEGFWNPKFLMARFSSVKGLVKIFNELFVLESAGYRAGDNIALVDLANPDVRIGKRLLPPGAYQKISKIEQLDGETLFAPTTIDGSVLLINSRTKAVRTVDLKELGVPVDAKILGKCLVVASYNPRKIIFYDLQTDKVANEWDFSTVGEDLSNIRSLTIDREAKRIFVKGVLPFNKLMGEPPAKRNSMVVGQEDDGKTFADCNS